MARDNAPIGNTCPKIDDVIEVLDGVADRLRELSDKLNCPALEEECNDIFEQAGNLKALFDGRRSPIEELRSANEQLRDWGNDQFERANEAEAECKDLRRQIDQLESA